MRRALGLVLLAAACSKGEEHAAKGYAAPKAADVPAAPVPVSLTPEPLAIGGTPLDGTIHPRAQAGAITGEDDRARAAFAITAPGQGWTFAWDDLAVLAVPDRTWMARRCEGREVNPKAGELTAALVAAAAGPFVDHDKCVPVLPPGEDYPRPLAALGAGDERSIILVRETLDVDNQTLFDIAESTDAGKTWTLKPGPADIRSHSVADVHADRVSGTVDVLLRAHHDTGEVILLLQLDGAHPLDIPPPVEVGRFALEDACRKGGATWWVDDAGKVWRAQKGVLTGVAGEPLAAAKVSDCSADQALVVAGGTAGPQMLHCKADGCKAAFPPPADGIGVLLSDGRAVRVAGSGNELHVTREGGDATTFTVQEATVLGGVVVWGDVPYAVVSDDPDGPPEIVALKTPG
jgi:hypothetical protein